MWTDGRSVSMCDRCGFTHNHSVLVHDMAKPVPWWKRAIETMEGRFLLALLAFGLVAMSC